MSSKPRVIFESKPYEERIVRVGRDEYVFEARSLDAIGVERWVGVPRVANASDSSSFVQMPRWFWLEVLRKLSSRRRRRSRKAVRK